MKKFAIIILSIVMIVACVALVACDKECTEHDWGEWVETTAATCTNTGVQTRTCKVCDKKDVRDINALGHVVTTVNGTPATCEDSGYTDGTKCSRCEVVLTERQYIAALGHTSQVVNGKEATCTEAGYTAGHICTVCDSVIDGLEEIKALGHEEISVPASEATCTVPKLSAGTKCSRCGIFLTEQQELAPAFGHDFSEGNYFTFTLCANNCGTYGSKTGGKPFETEFIFDFDESKQAEIDILYSQIQDALDENSSVSYDDFVEMFEEYDAAVGYLQAQYQFARILNDIDYSAESRNTLANVTDYYYVTIARYYTLFKDIDESRFKSQFWADTEWDEEYIEYVLSLADSYDADNRNAVDEILDKYEEWMAALNGTPTKKQLYNLFNLYSQFVEANNNIATAAGYNNYMEYAYENIYERDYGPEAVVAMRSLVKEYIGPLLGDVTKAYTAWNNAYTARGGWTSRAAQLYYSQYAGNWMWGDTAKYIDDAERLGMILDSRQSIADYFKYLDNGDDTVGFYGAVENLFETGNFFMGKNTNITAYTWYVYSTGTPILVFGGDDEYQDAFTFIHEFGHYYQFVHNKLLSVPMDHDETQSQGDEMLFLAWLKANMPQGVGEGFEILELEQLLNMLGSIIMSTAVDELEYLAYTGATEFNGQAIPTVKMSNGERVTDYATLYTLIMQSYWKDITSWFNTSYWMYVTFGSPAYYISYAMSALPCIELYAKAGNDGLDAARESYLKLFTFSSNQDFVEEDSFGDLYVKATYQEVLNWAGLSGPFEEGLYQSIQQYFSSRN